MRAVATSGSHPRRDKAPADLHARSGVWFADVFGLAFSAAPQTIYRNQLWEKKALLGTAPPPPPLLPYPAHSLVPSFAERQREWPHIQFCVQSTIQSNLHELFSLISLALKCLHLQDEVAAALEGGRSVARSCSCRAGSGKGPALCIEPEN